MLVDVGVPTEPETSSLETRWFQVSMHKCLEEKVCWIHHVTGMWVYPFLEHIGSGARIIFFGSTTILMNFLYLLGEVLNSYIWDTQRNAVASKESRDHEARTINSPGGCPLPEWKVTERCSH
ncbi:hypothetical protein NN561_006239 [Cricetulus griseus]